MSKSQGGDSNLGFGAWDFIGIWNLGFKALAKRRLEKIVIPTPFPLTLCGRPISILALC